MFAAIFSPQLFSFLAFMGIFLLLIGITEFLYRFFKLPAEQSRKFIHVSGGIMCLFLPIFFNSHIWPLLLAVLSFLLLFMTYATKYLNSIHKTKRRSIGSIIFPVPVYFCFLTAELSNNNLYFYVPVALLTFSDTAAEIAGNKWGYTGKQFFKGQKTLAGTTAFFVTSIIVCSLFFYFLPHIQTSQIIYFSLIISALTATAELITLHGWDNLTIPVVADIVLYILLK